MPQARNPQPQDQPDQPDQQAQDPQANQQDAGEVPVQDLPPNHPEDRTESSLTQDAGPDEQARAEAVAKRTGQANA